MRILVLSDSHGAEYKLRSALNQQPSVTEAVFLGDGERDADSVFSMYSQVHFTCVRGNCDFGSMLPYYELLEFGGKTIYATHGYVEHVKYGEGELISRARSFGADIALFGHTHRPVCSYEDGLYLFNPGSISDGNYGVIDITPAGVLCANLTLQ